MAARFVPTATRIIVFDVEVCPSTGETYRSVADIVEFPCGVEEAYQWARRHRGAEWAGKPHVAEQLGHLNGSRHVTTKASTYFTPSSPFPPLTLRQNPKET